MAAAIPGASPDQPLATLLPFPLDQAELLRQTALGDHGAFAQLYDATATRVHGLVLRVLRDPSQAEEVTQEVFLEVWRLASRFDPTRGSAQGWITTLAHRRAVDRVRTSESSRRRDARFHDLDAPLARAGRDHTADDAAASLDARAVREAMDCLTRLQRESIELAYFGGHTYREVAELLDVGSSTVKTRIRDGMLRLRESLASVG